MNEPKVFVTTYAEAQRLQKPEYVEGLGWREANDLSPSRDYYYCPGLGWRRKFVFR